MKVYNKEQLKGMGRKATPVIGYIFALSMIAGGLLMALGSAVFVMLFGEVVIGGFGFLGAVLSGGQGVIALQHQLEKSFCSQPVSFVQT